MNENMNWDVYLGVLTSLIPGVPGLKVGGKALTNLAKTKAGQKVINFFIKADKANGVGPSDIIKGSGKAIEGAIPNGENATISSKKLTEYALNPNHPVGGNKVKVFKNALGYDQSNADDLMKQIYKKISGNKAVLGKLDEYGQRYTVDIPITGPNGNTVNVRTGWIIKNGSDIPELTTIFVKD